MPPTELKPYELMQKVADFLEQQSIPYRIVDSMATIAYGEPRFTNDIDVLVDMPMERVDALCREFPTPDYSLSPEAAQEAIAAQSQFNILYITGGLKIDLFQVGGSEFDRLDLSQGQRLVSEGAFKALFASPENVILKKLVYFQEGGSEKHLRDIVGVLLIQGQAIDHGYLNEWAAKLGVVEELQLFRHRQSERGV